MITNVDLVAVQHAHTTDGRAAALAEIRRLWPDISETVLSATLDRILAAARVPPSSTSDESCMTPGQGRKGRG